MLGTTKIHNIRKKSNIKSSKFLKNIIVNLNWEFDVSS